jgi:hypothetical protein
MKSYDAQATIKATPERIWKLLTDGPNYPGWNPSVERIEGKIAPGETITVIVKVNPGRAFPVKVTEFQPGKRMVWSGGMPLGLFKGERTYTLEPGADGMTHFTMREEYSGPLLSIIWKSIPDLGPAFEQFATGLKAGAEREG